MHDPHRLTMCSGPGEHPAMTHKQGLQQASIAALVDDATCIYREFFVVVDSKHRSLNVTAEKQARVSLAIRLLDGYDGPFIGSSCRLPSGRHLLYACQLIGFNLLPSQLQAN